MDAWILEPNDYDLLMDGAWITVQILVYSFVLGVLLSLIFGVGRLSERRWVRGTSLAYVEFSRGISSIVLLFIVAIGLPILLGIEQWSLIGLATIALGINMGGYGAEIVRGSIQAIPKGQTEASIALNLTPTQRLRHIILPQAMRIILPPMGNLTIEILKGTALASLVGVREILQATDQVRTRGVAGGNAADIAVIFMNALVLYFLLAQVVNAVFKFFERRLERRFQGGEAELPADLDMTAVGGAG